MFHVSSLFGHKHNSCGLHTLCRHARGNARGVSGAKAVIAARKIGAFSRLFGAYSRRILKKNFRRVLIAGEDALPSAITGRCVIFFANHSCWWDAILPCYLSSTRWKIDSYGMMDERQLEKYRFFRLTGTFSVNRSNARDAVRSLDYAAEILRSPGRSLWMYPQGELLSNDLRPLVFYGGIEHIARRLDRTVTLVPVAFRYEFLNDQKPEAFIRIGRPLELAPGTIPENGSLVHELAARLTDELDALRCAVASRTFGEFLPAIEGRRSINELYDSFMKR